MSESRSKVTRHKRPLAMAPPRRLTESRRCLLCYQAGRVSVTRRWVSMRTHRVHASQMSFAEQVMSSVFEQGLLKFPFTSLRPHPLTPRSVPALCPCQSQPTDGTNAPRVGRGLNSARVIQGAAPWCRCTRPQSHAAPNIALLVVGLCVVDN